MPWAWEVGRLGGSSFYSTHRRTVQQFVSRFVTLHPAEIATFFQILCAVSKLVAASVIVDDTTHFEEHGWTNGNVEAGVARVLDSYITTMDGELLYDIKYIVGGKQKGVEAEHVKPRR